MDNTEAAAVPTATAAEARSRLLDLLRRRRGSVAAVIALSGASTAAALAGPALIGVVVDAVVEGGGADSVDRVALAFLVLSLLGAALMYLARARAAVVGESALVELREEVFEHVLALPVSTIERARTGELVSRVTGDVSTLARAVRHTVPSVVFAVIEGLLTVGALALLDLRLAGLGLAAGAPVAAAGGRWYLRRAPARYQAERRARAAWSGSLLEAYRGRTTLVAYRAAAAIDAGLEGLGRATVEAELACAVVRNRLRPAVSTSLALSLAAVVLAGAVLVDGGSITIGAVSAAALYVVRLFDPIGILLEEVDTIQQATAAVARLVGVTQLPVAAPAKPGKAAPPSPAAGIEVDGVTFGYRTGLPVVRSVDLDVESGEHVVVVGASGAGKSTLAKIVCGAVEPWEGQVRIGGTPVREIDAAAMPQVVAMVAQEGHVFARSVADNVRLGRPDATLEEIRAALATVEALDWAAALPAGLETPVGSGNHPLSLPQAQQLGLARIVCRDPAVVVLDEATADLDPAAAVRTERHVEAALAGRTVVSVAHRLGSASRADRVVVMEAGSVVQSGSPQELLSTEGPYALLWQSWLADVRGFGEDAASE